MQAEHGPETIKEGIFVMLDANNVIFGSVYYFFKCQIF